MSSQNKPEAKKHLIVIEFTVDESINPTLIPWTDLLHGAAYVSNWRNLTPELLKQHALGSAFDDFTTESEFDDVEQSLEALRKAAELNDSIPDEITPWQPFEDCTAKELLEHIEESYKARMVGYSLLLQHEVNHE